MGALESMPSLNPDTLTAWLQASCGDGDRCVALIDPSRYADSEECALALGFDDATFAELPNLYQNYSVSLKSMGPRLFSAELQDGHWVAIGREAVQRQAASFIVMPRDVEGLREHLASLTKIQQVDGSNLLFRFQDTIVMSSLAPLLTPHQCVKLLGPASAWLVPGLCGEPLRIERQTLRGPVPSNFSLTHEQSQALDSALAPMVIIGQANETDSTLLGQMSKCQQVRLIRKCILRAKPHGLSRQEDVALFCVLSLQLPASFDSEGPVARALARVRTDNIGFGDAIDQVPPEEWRAYDEVLDTHHPESMAK